MVQERIYNYFNRNPQLHVLFIFDKMNINSAELELAEWPDNYVYKVFDGAWFNIKYAIENTWKDKRIVLLFTDGTYPHTEDQMLQFPLLDMLKANMEYKEDDYASFMQQYNLPEKFRLFIKNNISEIQSTKISSLLEGYLTPETFSEDLVCRAFISSYLGDKLLDWEPIIVRMIILGMQSEEKRRNDFYYRLSKNQDAKKAIDAKLKKIFDRSYNPNSEIKIKEVVECLKYNSITQLLEEIPADNYKQYKIKNQMMLEGQNKVYEYGLQNRHWSEKFNQAMVELGKDIKEEMIIATYGIDAQYNYMPEALCWPILKEILEKELMSEPDEVNDRMRNMALKFSAQSDVLIVIKYIEQVALYYEKVKSVGTLKLNTPEAYVQKYIDKEEGLYLADMCYRHSLEAYHQLITKEIPIEQTINEVKRQLDIEYAKLTNILNLEWLTCVMEHDDLFDGLSIPKQENLYSDEITSESQVIIISDALRYEVAVDLMQELASKKTDHDLKLTVRKAMLPTETKYCKTAMLPHHTLTFQGNEMAVDNVVLSSIDSRTNHLRKYKEKSVCISYEELMNGAVNSKRELFKQYPLVYVFHDTIDRASHSQSPFEVISACRKAIEELKILIPRIMASWNVTNIVVTSDHGFIYNDQLFEEKDKHSITEVCEEKKTRYYLTKSSVSVEGIAKFPIRKVSGIQSSDLFVAVPLGTNRLAAPGGYNFAHGGATLQEMIIPVIIGHKGRQQKTDKVGVSLMNHNLNMVSSRLKFHLIQSEAVSMTIMERKVVCQVFNGDEPVTTEKELLLNSTDSANINNRVFEITLNLNKSVSSSVLQLRIYDVDDKLNPLIKETVKNNTMIEQDF